MDPESCARVETLCRQLGHGAAATRAVRDGLGEAKLIELLTLLRAPVEPDDAQVTALLDEVDDAATKGGLQGLTTVVRTEMPDLPAGTVPAPEVIGWSCPLRRCSRVVLADESTVRPLCAAGDTGMRPYRAISP